MIAFAGLALLLAITGVYGVNAYAVSQRRSEFGRRLALGDSREKLLHEIVGEGLHSTALGLVTGLGGMIWMASLLKGGPIWRKRIQSGERCNYSLRDDTRSDGGLRGCSKGRSTPIRRASLESAWSPILTIRYSGVHLAVRSGQKSANQNPRSRTRDSWLLDESRFRRIDLSPSQAQNFRNAHSVQHRAKSSCQPVNIPHEPGTRRPNPRSVR
jgi:hypothetical protein